METGPKGVFARLREMEAEPSVALHSEENSSDH